jgi:hypothetical protein
MNNRALLYRIRHTHIYYNKSADFGSTWSASSLVISMTDVWVSATGQHVGAVATPQGGATRFYYSVDYGRTYSNTILTTTGAFRCLAGSGDGSTLVLGAINATDFGQSSDGKIRVARTDLLPVSEFSYTNSVLSLNPAKQLWASVDFRTNSNIYQINFFPNKIDMRYYNIEYEFEFFWERATATTFLATFLSLGLNNFFASSTANQSATRKGAITQWTFISPRFSTDGSPYHIPQSFAERFYAGFAPALGLLNNEYRSRTILKGELSLNFRTINDIAFNGGNADNSINERTLHNRFTCDSHLIEYFSPTEWGIHYENNDNIQYSPQSIQGSAQWNASLGGVWDAGTGTDPMSTGIHQVFIASTNTAYTGQGRPCQVKARIFRVRK